MSIVNPAGNHFNRSESSAPDCYELDRRRVYIFPTRYGFGFYVVLAVMLIGSINYNNSLGFLLTFLLASLSLVAILHTFRNLVGLKLRVRSAQEVFAGQEARFSLQLDNLHGDQRTGLTVTYPIDPQSDDTGLGLVQTNIAPGKFHTLDIKVRTTRRGHLCLGRVVLASRFPLGLFRAWANYETSAGAIVYPRPTGHREPPCRPSHTASSGDTRSQGTEDFMGLRGYVPGDSSRRIHWKAVARGQQTTVKLFSGAARTQSLRWAETQQDTVEGSLSQLALWVVEAARSGLSFSLELPGESFAHAQGNEHRRRCLQALAMYRLAEDPPS